MVWQRVDGDVGGIGRGEGKGREGKGREGKEREGKEREGKERESNGIKGKKRKECK